MRYESIKDISFENIKSKNISNFLEYKYGIEKLNLGKYYHSKYTIYIFKFIFNFLNESLSRFSFSTKNIFYKNDLVNEKYSKCWWNIPF